MRGRIFREKSTIEDHLCCETCVSESYVVKPTKMHSPERLLDFHGLWAEMKPRSYVPSAS